MLSDMNEEVWENLTLDLNQATSCRFPSFKGKSSGE